MSTAGRTGADAPAASDVAGQCREADLVRLVAAPTGDALAATGLLARALAATDRAFQVSVASLPTDADRATDSDLTVAIGRTDPTADLSVAADAVPATETALAAASDLGGDPDPALALAGVVADGRIEGGDAVEAARAAGIERRPGLAVPTTDLVDGLAYSLLVSLSVSGDTDAVAGLLTEHGLPTDAADADEDATRRLASLVAVAATDEGAPTRAAHAVERALRPFDGGPFGTVGGYADVLDAVGRERPGIGVALALGHDVSAAALDAWRTHADRAHAAVAEATTARYDGLFVARAESAAAPVETAARLYHDFRSPEAVTLVVTDGAAAAVADDADLADPIAAATDAADGTGEVTRARQTVGRARFEADTSTFITAFREAQ